MVAANSKASPVHEAELPTDAEIAEAVRRSDSLELVGPDDLAELFTPERWSLTEGGSSC